MHATTEGSLCAGSFESAETPENASTRFLYVPAGISKLLQVARSLAGAGSSLDADHGRHGVAGSCRASCLHDGCPAETMMR